MAEVSDEIFARKVERRRQRQESLRQKAIILPLFYNGIDPTTGKAKLLRPDGGEVADGKVVTNSYIPIGDRTLAIKTSRGDVRVDKPDRRRDRRVPIELPEYYIWVTGFLGHCTFADRLEFDLDSNQAYQRFKSGYKARVQRQSFTSNDASGAIVVTSPNYQHLRAKFSFTNRSLILIGQDITDPQDYELTVLLNVQVWAKFAGSIKATREASGGVTFPKADRSGNGIYDDTANRYLHEFQVKIAQISDSPAPVPPLTCVTATDSYTIDIKVEDFNFL